jgi:hypothetical protein
MDGSTPLMERACCNDPTHAVVGLLDRDAELLHLPLPHEKVMYLLATNGSAGASEVPTGLASGDVNRLWGCDGDDDDDDDDINMSSFMCGRISCDLTLFTSPGTRGRGLV